jgi:hypothetical protein
MSKHGPLKRGDARKDGKIFLKYKCKGKEVWLSYEKFLALKEKRRKTQGRYYYRHRKRRCEEASIYQKKRKKQDFLFKLRLNTRSLISVSFKRNGFKKSSKLFNILGCSFEEFKDHLESQFQPGMSWDNRNLWHIDHIMPVSMAKNYDELVRLNHYRNLRPLWAFDNISKGATKIDLLVLF